MRHFERRIFLGVLIIVASFLPLIVTAFFALERIVGRQHEFISTNAQEVILAEKLRYLFSTQIGLMPVYVLTGDTSLIHGFDERKLQSEDLIKQILASETDQKTIEQIVRIKAEVDELHSFAAPGIRMRKSGASIAAVNDYFQSVTGPKSAQIVKDLNDLVRREHLDFQDAKSHNAAIADRLIGILIVFSLLTLGLVAVIVRLMARAISQKRTYDLTQETLFERERRLSLARKETVEMVSHDLKNPLGTIKMSVEMMSEELANLPVGQFDDLREGLAIVRRSAESMERLIRDLLDHAKIESGHLEICREDCRVAGLIDDLCRRFAPLTGASHVTLIPRVRDRALVVSCDLGRMEQVLSNLIGNAIKFTPAGGRIEVAAEAVDDDLVISVRDTGPGISAEQISHVFDRFWQVRATAKKGTGLGLAISKAIVEAHEGRIWVESEPGHGATFFLKIPLRYLETKAKMQGASEPVQKPLEPHATSAFSMTV